MDLSGLLPWRYVPPAIRKRVRNYLLAACLAPIAAIALVIFDEPLGIPREPWGRFGPLGLGLIPVVVLWPMFLFAQRRLRSQFHEARGRLCTHCAYNVAPQGERGTCPECGH